MLRILYSTQASAACSDVIASTALRSNPAVCTSLSRSQPLTRAPGRVTDAQLRWLYANAAALVATSNEDFGLTPVEAFGFGTPVVALRAGGYLDSCVDGVTGVWVEDPSVGGVGDGLRRFRSAAFDRDTIIAHGAQWSPQRFAGRLAALINEVL